MHSQTARPSDPDAIDSMTGDVPDERSSKNY